MLSDMPAMRDVFWNHLYEKAKEDRDIVVLSTDFSAPSLDRFRLELPAQYIRLGIAEQIMILMAAGMALEGKRPFCYAIAPFLTMRCFEQIRLYVSGMNLPITLIGVGAGFAYADSGYTHHALEDVALMRTLPHMKIYQPCDTVSVKAMADQVLSENKPAYFRLDRYEEEKVSDDFHGIAQGIRIVNPVQKVTLIASGYMIKTAQSVARLLEIEGMSVGILDICTLPFDEDIFAALIKQSKTIITLEEHILSGGMGCYILETVYDLKIPVQIHRVGLDLSGGYINEYSGREVIHRICRIDTESIVNLIKELENKNEKM